MEKCNFMTQNTGRIQNLVMVFTMLIFVLIVSVTAYSQENQQNSDQSQIIDVYHPSEELLERISVMRQEYDNIANEKKKTPNSKLASALSVYKESNWYGAPRSGGKMIERFELGDISVFSINNIDEAAKLHDALSYLGYYNAQIAAKNWLLSHHKKNDIKNGFYGLFILFASTHKLDSDLIVQISQEKEVDLNDFIENAIAKNNLDLIYKLAALKHGPWNYKWWKG